jgi:hypothetical protein
VFSFKNVCTESGAAAKFGYKQSFVGRDDRSCCFVNSGSGVRISPAVVPCESNGPRASRRAGHLRATVRRRRHHASFDAAQQQGRALAVHAFLHGARCRERRVGELFGVSRRTVGRDRAEPLQTAPPILAVAQTLITASADRGSSPEERMAAAAWLTAGATPGSVDGAEPTVPVPPLDMPNISSPLVEVPMSAERQESPAHASWTRDQMDVCSRLHRRIRVHTDAIRRLLEPET